MKDQDTGCFYHSQRRGTPLLITGDLRYNRKTARLPSTAGNGEFFRPQGQAGAKQGVVKMPR